MSDKLKVDRGHRKATVTRLLGTLECLMAEDVAADVVAAKLKDVKAAFGDLEVAHDAYTDSLEAEADILKSEAWYNSAQQNYVTRVKSANDWIKSKRVNSDNANVSGASASSTSTGGSTSKAGSDPVSQTDFMNMWSVPKVDLDKFDGDPLDFQTFMSLFDESIGNILSDDQMKLTRLLYYVCGPAKAAIKGCALVGGTEGYKQARDILKSRFGNVHLISQRIVNELKCGGSVSKSYEIQQLVDELVVALSSLQKLNRMSEVENQSCIIEILGRCPLTLCNKWKKLALAHRRKHDDYPKFADFVEFIRSNAYDVCDPVYGNETFKPPRARKKASSHFVVSETSGKELESAHVMAPSGAKASAASAPKQPISQPCVLCKQNHRLFHCESFKSLQPSARFQVVKVTKLCYNCLLPGHFTRDCRKMSFCSVPNCGRKHTKFIHIDNDNDAVTHATGNDVSSANPQVSNAGASTRGANVGMTHVTGNDTSLANAQVSNASAGAHGANVYLPMVAVKVNGERVLALLDNGSTNTFMSQTLASRLGLSGEKLRYTITTLSQKSLMSPRAVTCNVSSLDGGFSECLNGVLVVPSIPTRYPQREIDITRYPYLSDIALPSISSGEKAELLIGMDNSHLLMPIEVRSDENATRAPYATRSVFGWALNGPVEGCNDSHVRGVSSFHITLEEQVGNMWEFENRDVNDMGKVCYSVEDQRVLDLWQSEIEFDNGHYTLPIPWRQSRPSLPNNRYLAECRLHSQVRRLNKTGLLNVYNDNVTKMVDNGYAERVPDSDLLLNDGSIWYLPHHHVTSESKPGKIRVVFDCAAKYHDVSLNNQCLQGPDVTNKLISVLLRFRQFKFAVMGDIEAMYLQVRIPWYDRNALRFLWLEKDNIVEYRMTSHLFWGVWCSSSSTFALRQTVCDLPDHDLIKDTVLRAFYVDDLLKSVQSAEEVTRVINETRQVIGRGGFKLTKFVINDKQLLETIDVDDRASEVRSVVPDMCSRALGIQWHVNEDSFRYVNKREQIDDATEITRRHILSCVSSMYDPLGQISPIVLTGKMFFQEATRRGLDWDDPVPDDLARKWRAWQSSLQNLCNLSFSRCVVPAWFENGIAELHHFSDASAVGYGACSYLRVVAPDGRINVSLIASKGRLAPLKTITIPRLELTAAVTAVQLDILIRSSLDIECMPSTFWTDSKIVLAYICSEHKRFKVFVANRVRSDDVPQLTNGITSMGITTRPMWYLEVVVLMMSRNCGSKGPSFCLSSSVTGQLMMTSIPMNLWMMIRTYIRRHVTTLPLVFIPWHVSTRQRRCQRMRTLWMPYWIIILATIKREKRCVGCDGSCHSWEENMWKTNP